MALEQYADQWGNFAATATETISGGQFVKALSVGEAGTSRPDEILQVALADATGDEKLAVGIAINNATSGELVTVATRGLFKTTALGTCVAGHSVMAAANSNEPAGVKPVTAGSYIVPGARPVGTALNTAVSGEKVFVNLCVGGL